MSRLEVHSHTLKGHTAIPGGKKQQCPSVDAPFPVYPKCPMQVAASTRAMSWFTSLESVRLERGCSALSSPIGHPVPTFRKSHAHTNAILSPGSDLKAPSHALPYTHSQSASPLPTQTLACSSLGPGNISLHPFKTITPQINSVPFFSPPMS